MTAALPPLAILDFLGGSEILLILVVVLIFFGGDKMPEFARGLGKILKEFKKATTEVEHEIRRAMEDPLDKPTHTVRPPPAIVPNTNQPALPPAAPSQTPAVESSAHEASPASDLPTGHAHPFDPYQDPPDLPATDIPHNPTSPPRRPPSDSHTGDSHGIDA